MYYRSISFNNGRVINIEFNRVYTIQSYGYLCMHYKRAQASTPIRHAEFISASLFTRGILPNVI